MITFDIPYAPVRYGIWSVDVSNNGQPEFTSRKEALRFAVAAALISHQLGDSALINVEGVDGQWRMFDHGMKGMA